MRNILKGIDTRLVAKRFMQYESIGYIKTLVSSKISFRIIVASCTFDLKVHHIHVKATFPNGEVLRKFTCLILKVFEQGKQHVV